VQRDIFNAASAEDYMITTSATGEPVIATMELDNSDAVTASFRPKKGGITAYQLWQVQKLRIDLRKEYLDHWEATASETGTGRPIDAIICPAAPYAAPPHGKNKSVHFFAGVLKYR
jgi:amidase